MNVNLNDLPSNIKSQIPISLRINKQSLVYEDLPTELQFILSPYAGHIYSRPTTSNILDYKPDLGIYGDWDELTTLSSTILEYIKNWFKTPIGSYPYDLFFGSSLNKILHTKDTALQNQLLKNEINTIDSLVNNMYPSSFTVESMDVVPVEFEDHIEYQLSMKIKLLNRAIAISVTQ